MFVHLVAHLPSEVSSVLLALQVNMWRQLLIYVCNVQQVTCQKNKTVKHVLSVAKVKRQLEMEVLHVRNVTQECTVKAQQVSVQIVQLAITRTEKVKNLAWNARLIHTRLRLARHRKPTA